MSNRKESTLDQVSLNGVNGCLTSEGNFPMRVSLDNGKVSIDNVSLVDNVDSSETAFSGNGPDSLDKSEVSLAEVSVAFGGFSDASDCGVFPRREGSTNLGICRGKTTKTWAKGSFQGSWSYACL